MRKDDFEAVEYAMSREHCFYNEIFINASSQAKKRIQILKNEESYISFKETDFARLKKIVFDLVTIENKYQTALIWSLIKHLSVEVMFDRWIDRFGDYPRDKDLKLNSLIDYFSTNVNYSNIEDVGLFTYYLMNKGAFPIGENKDFFSCCTYLTEKIQEKLERDRLNAFKSKLSGTNDNNTINRAIDDIDLMNGYEFETFVSSLFSRMGYITEVTKGSGDQGLDVLAENQNIKIGIQAKCYTKRVTNKSVQEIKSALNHYSCDRGIVVTNNYFTDSAIELAHSNDIILWDRDILSKKIEELY